jgi:hypothetical protein
VYPVAYGRIQCFTAVRAEYAPKFSGAVRGGVRRAAAVVFPGFGGLA